MRQIARQNGAALQRIDHSSIRARTKPRPEEVRTHFDNGGKWCSQRLLCRWTATTDMETLAKFAA